jgi:hypothetical protein
MTLTVRQISFLMSALVDLYQGDRKQFEKDLDDLEAVNVLSPKEVEELKETLGW